MPWSGAERVAFNLADPAETMRGRRNETDNVKRKLMTLEERNGGLRVRLYVQYLRGQRAGGAHQVTYGNGLLPIGRAE